MNLAAREGRSESEAHLRCEWERNSGKGNASASLRSTKVQVRRRFPGQSPGIAPIRSWQRGVSFRAIEYEPEALQPCLVIRHGSTVCNRSLTAMPGTVQGRKIICAAADAD